MTEAACRYRHNRIWWTLGITISLLGLSATGAGFTARHMMSIAVDAAVDAGEDAEKAKEDAHKALEDVKVVKTGQKFILEGISRIEASQIRLEAKVDSH